MRELFVRCLDWFRRGRLERELAEELRFHRERAEREAVAEGASSEEARWIARRRFGNRTYVAEDARERWSLPAFDQLLQDVRYALRALRRAPGFTATALLTLGLGIGANTAMFSFVDAILLRPPARVPSPARLVTVFTSDFSGPPFGTSSYADYTDFARRLEGTASLAAYAQSQMVFDAGDNPAVATVTYASPNYFAVLGVRPAAGRLIGQADEPAIVLSYEFWQRALGAAPGVIGRVVRLDNRPVTVIGVTPRGFAGPTGRQPSDAYVPAQFVAAFQAAAGGSTFLDQRSSRRFSIVGRLEPGATADAVSSRLTALSAALQREYPRAWTDVHQAPRRVTVLSGRRAWASPNGYQQTVTLAAVLMALVAVVLLIACANVANLLLARATRRRQEIAVRLAIGAGRGRLVRQLVTESLLLAGAAGALGVVLAMLGTAALRAAGGALPIAGALEAHVDVRVLLFALALSLAAGLAFGLAPAMITAHRDPAATLKAERTGGGQSGVIRSVLVAGQVAGCVVLLIGSSLLVRSLRNAVRTDLGFDPRGVVVAPLTLPTATYSIERAAQFVDGVRARTGSLPGVTRAAVASQVPLSGQYNRRQFQPEGYERAPGEDMELDYDVVGPDWLELMRIPLLRGRGFTGDAPVDAHSVVVNAAFAERYWPGQNAVGKHVEMPESGESILFEVVGVTPTGKVRGLDEEARPMVYLPLAGGFVRGLTLFVRTDGDAPTAVAAVRAELRAMDPHMPTASVQTLASVIAGQVLPLRLAGTLFTGFGVLALIIAMIGVYGVLSYAVSRRTREIGIRIALGAPATRVALMIGSQGLLLVALGAVAGVAVAPLAVRPLGGLLFGVGATDPAGIAIVLATLGVVSAFAALLPAVRASRVDPLTALREE
jgi:predicted permease